jgi:hypothetical protein
MATGPPVAANKEMGGKIERRIIRQTACHDVEMSLPPPRRQPGSLRLSSGWYELSKARAGREKTFFFEKKNQKTFPR